MKRAELEEERRCASRHLGPAPIAPGRAALRQDGAFHLAAPLPSHQAHLDLAGSLEQEGAGG